MADSLNHNQPSLITFPKYTSLQDTMMSKVGGLFNCPSGRDCTSTDSVPPYQPNSREMGIRLPHPDSNQDASITYGQFSYWPYSHMTKPYALPSSVQRDHCSFPFWCPSPSTFPWEGTLGTLPQILVDSGLATCFYLSIWNFTSGPSGDLPGMTSTPSLPYFCHQFLAL